MSASVKQLVDSTVAGNKIAIFSKSYCPHCAKAKALLTNYPGIDSADIKIIELDELDNGGEIQSYLTQKTSQRTVPNIFISQQHIGGNDDLQKAEQDGKVKELLAQ